MMDRFWQSLQRLFSFFRRAQLDRVSSACSWCVSVTGTDTHGELADIGAPIQ